MKKGKGRLISYAIIAIAVVGAIYAWPIVGGFISEKLGGGIDIDLSSIPFIGEKLSGPPPFEPTETKPEETPEVTVLKVEEGPGGAPPPAQLTPQPTPVPRALPTKEGKSLVQMVGEGSEGYTQIKYNIEQAFGFDLLDWIVKGIFALVALFLGFKMVIPWVIKGCIKLLRMALKEVGGFVGEKLKSPQVLGFLITILGLGVLTPSTLKAPSFVALTSVSILWPLMLGVVGYILLSKWDLIEKIMDVFGGFFKIAGLLIWLIIGVFPKLGLNPSTFLSGKAAVVANSIETANQTAIGAVSAQATGVSSSLIAISLLITVLGAFLINEGSDGGGLFRGEHSGPPQRD